MLKVSIDLSGTPIDWLVLSGGSVVFSSGSMRSDVCLDSLKFIVWVDLELTLAEAATVFVLLFLVLTEV